MNRSARSALAVLTMLALAAAGPISAGEETNAPSDAAPPKPETNAATKSDARLAQMGDKWKNFLADWSGASVSASGMLGLSGEAVTTIDNKRNLTLALQGLLGNDPANALGLAITPARTSLAPMNLSDYAREGAAGGFMRFLGNLTLSYAQGPITLEEVDYKRKAYAIDSNFYFKREADPAVAYAMKFKTDDKCWPFSPQEPVRTSETSNGSGEEGDAVHLDGKDAPADVGAILDKCRASAEEELSKRWNRSQMSFAYGEARIRPKDDSRPEVSMGKTLVVTLLYGFDRLWGQGEEAKSEILNLLSKNYALTLNYRKSTDEPVLATLTQPQINFKDSSLFIARLTGGTATSRVLFEVSNARSRDITASQRAFKQALGIDYRITEGAWLNLRVGKQRTVDGSDDETGTLFSISYSPEALLKR